MSEVLISLIVPTRGRAQRMIRFLESVAATASRPDSIEVVMVVDADDSESQRIRFSGLRTEMVVVEPGLTMGALNMAGYAKSRGAYIMLMNDDVVVRTSAWDVAALRVFGSFHDEIVLVHVNDRIFGDRLCTFPFLSRRFCEMAGGICEKRYQRYRIDDHIYNVFNLLALLGQRRIVYLPDVVFEHENTVLGKTGIEAYVPDPVIHARDTGVFDELLEARKEFARRLLEWIDRSRRSGVDAMRAELLKSVTDSVSLRRPEYVRTLAGPALSVGTPRVTVAVVSADLHCEHARTCIDLLKRHTRDFDLLVLDNNHGPGFNHSREMNRALEVCRTDYLVLMDDDVFVPEGWLDRLLAAVGPGVGVVTPMHLDRTGSLSYAGVVMNPDCTGHHSHSHEAVAKPTPIQTLCSAVMLIDMGKVGHLRLDESYSKYFLDIDYGLRVWEAGYQVVCADGVCTHLGGATLAQGCTASEELFETQRRHWLREWVDTGRYARLERGAWSAVPELRPVLELPQVLSDLMRRSDADSLEDVIERASARLRVAEHVPVLRRYIRARVDEAVGGAHCEVNDPRHGHLMVLYGIGGSPVLVHQGWYRHDLYLMGSTFYAVPTNAATPTEADLGAYAQGDDRVARSLSQLRSALIGNKPRRGKEAPPYSSRNDGQLPAAGQTRSARPGVRLVQSGFLRYNIVLADRYYGLLQRDGAFNAARLAQGGYRHLVSGESVGSVKLAIVRTWLHRLPRIAFNRLRRRLEMQHSRGIAAGAVAAAGEGPAAVAAPFAKRNLEHRLPGPAPQSQSIVEVICLDRSGHAVFSFEEKYFCVPRESLEVIGGSLTPELCRVDRVEGMQVFHSLAEMAEALAASDAPEVMGEGALVLTTLPLDVTEALLDSNGLLKDGQGVEILAGDKSRGRSRLPVHRCGTPTLGEWAMNGAELPPPLDQRHFASIVIPWSFPESWSDNSIEAAASRLGRRVRILPAGGRPREYAGENLHRLVYNKAYLSSMFQVVPSPAGRRLLEVGCSDGLVCDLMIACGAQHVTGIDVMRTAGCRFPAGSITYATMDASRMQFDDESFDIVYSIATMEHVPDPLKVLSEIKRVTRRGGYAYVQAGPLYHSPFGHHMFAYFTKWPWIHLLESKDRILDRVRSEGIDRQIRADLGRSAEEYIESMMTFEHVNGLFLQEYGLERFMKQPDIETLKFNVSYEGRELLDDRILGALAPLTREQLTEHGFELAFRRR